MGKPGFPIALLESFALPNPLAGWGVAKPGFATPLLEGGARSNPPTGWGYGETRAAPTHPPYRTGNDLPTGTRSSP